MYTKQSKEYSWYFLSYQHYCCLFNLNNNKKYGSYTENIRTCRQLK